MKCSVLLLLCLATQCFAQTEVEKDKNIKPLAAKSDSLYPGGVALAYSPKAEIQFAEIFPGKEFADSAELGIQLKMNRGYRYYVIDSLKFEWSGNKFRTVDWRVRDSVFWAIFDGSLHTMTMFLLPASAIRSLKQAEVKAITIFGRMEEGKGSRPIQLRIKRKSGEALKQMIIEQF